MTIRTEDGLIIINPAGAGTADGASTAAADPLDFLTPEERLMWEATVGVYFTPQVQQAVAGAYGGTPDYTSFDRNAIPSSDSEVGGLDTPQRLMETAGQSVRPQELRDGGFPDGFREPGGTPDYTSFDRNAIPKRGVFAPGTWDRTPESEERMASQGYFWDGSGWKKDPRSTVSGGYVDELTVRPGGREQTSTGGDGTTTTTSGGDGTTTTTSGGGGSNEDPDNPGQGLPLPEPPSDEDDGGATGGDAESNQGSYEEGTWDEIMFQETLSLLYFIPDYHSVNAEWGHDLQSSIRGGLAAGWTGAQIAKWWTTTKAKDHFKGFIPTRWATVGAYLRDRDAINQLLDDRGLGDIVQDINFGFDQADDPVGTLMAEGFDTQDLVNRLDHYFRIIQSPDARHLYNAIYIGSGKKLSDAQLAEVMEQTPLGREIVASYERLQPIDSQTALSRAAELVTDDLSAQLGGIAGSSLLKAQGDRDTVTRLLAAFLDRDMSLTDAIDVTEETLLQMAAFGQGVTSLSNEDLNELAAMGASRSDAALSRARGSFGMFSRKGRSISAELRRFGGEGLTAGDYVEADLFGSGSGAGALEYLRRRQGGYGSMEGAFRTSLDQETGRFHQSGRRPV